MTDRKVKGVGYLITGALFAGVGGILMFMTSTPEWVVQVLNIVAIVVPALGFKIIVPEDVN